MTTWAVVLAFVGAVNPFRRRSALNVCELRTVALGAAVTFAGIGVCALVGATLRDALDVSAPNARIAAGLVLLVVGLHAVVARVDDPAHFGAPGTERLAWLAPVAFPVLFRPDLALVAFAAEAGDLAPVAVGAALALAATAGWWHHRGASAPVDRAERAAGAALAVALALAAVRLVLDGVFAL